MDFYFSVIFGIIKGVILIIFKFMDGYKQPQNSKL